MERLQKIVNAKKISDKIIVVSSAKLRQRMIQYGFGNGFGMDVGISTMQGQQKQKKKKKKRLIEQIAVLPPTNFIVFNHVHERFKFKINCFRMENKIENNNDNKNKNKSINLQFYNTKAYF